MASCVACGEKLEPSGLACPKCKAPVLTATPFEGTKLPSAKELAAQGAPAALGDGALAMLARAATAEVPLGATHRYAIARRYELGAGIRPLSVVLDGDDFLALALEGESVVILRFAGSGEAKGRLGSWKIGGGPDEIGDPAGIALDREGRAFVLDAAACGVVVIDGSGRVAGRFGEEGSGTGQLRYPRDIEVSSHGLLLADTRNNRIQRWDLSGNHVLTIGAAVDEDEDDSVPAGTRPGEFDGPMGVTGDAQGGIYVADTNNHRIQVFDREGKFVRQFGREGAGAGSLQFPTDVRLGEGGATFVFDLHSRRVQKFDGAGALVYGVVLREEGPHSVVGAVGDIDVGPDETIYLPVPGEGVVLRCTRAGA